MLAELCCLFRPMAGNGAELQVVSYFLSRLAPSRQFSIDLRTAGVPVFPRPCVCGGGYQMGLDAIDADIEKGNSYLADIDTFCRAPPTPDHSAST